MLCRAYLKNPIKISHQSILIFNLIKFKMVNIMINRANKIHYNKV